MKGMILRSVTPILGVVLLAGCPQNQGCVVEAQAAAAPASPEEAAAAAKQSTATQENATKKSDITAAVNTDERLKELGAGLKYPSKVCMVTDLKQAEECLPGEIFSFRPERWGNDQLPIVAVGGYCDHDYPIVWNNGGVSCRYKKNEFSVGAGMRFNWEELKGLRQRFSEEYLAIVESGGEYKKSGDRQIWVKEMASGTAAIEINDGCKVSITSQRRGPGMEFLGEFTEEIGVARMADLAITEAIRDYWGRSGAKLRLVLAPGESPFNEGKAYENLPLVLDVEVNSVKCPEETKPTSNDGNGTDV